MRFSAGRISRFKMALASAIIMALVAVPVARARTLGEIDHTAGVNYRNAKSKYLNEVSFYRIAKNQLLAAKRKLLTFGSAGNKNVVEARARFFLAKAMSILIKRLESIRIWVANRGAIEETQRQAIIAELDSDINTLNQKLTAIASAPPDEVKNQARQLRDYWRSRRGAAKKIAGQILSARIGALVAKAEDFSARVGQRVESLKAAGMDTSEIETRLADANHKISLAREKYQTAKAKFAAISNLSDANQLFREGHQFIKEAHQFIRSAHSDLVTILKEMKEAT